MYTNKSKCKNRDKSWTKVQINQLHKGIFLLLMRNTESAKLVYTLERGI